MSTSPLQAELETAVRLARRAGAAAMAFYGTAEKTLKEGGTPVTAADLAANRVIVGGLLEAFPDDGILSEESKDDPSRLERERVWIVDPLDGTKEFLARNGEFSVMIALAIDGVPAVGVVYRPDGDVLYAAERGQGAWKDADGARVRLDALGGGARTSHARLSEAGRRAAGGMRMVGSRSHGDPLIDRMAAELGVDEHIPHGSVGLKCSLLADGRAEVYVHPVPYLSEWDTCAPEIILREAGGSVTDCTGRSLVYNKQQPKQPHGIAALARGVPAEVRGVLVGLYAEGRPDT